MTRAFICLLVGIASNLAIANSSITEFSDRLEQVKTELGIELSDEEIARGIMNARTDHQDMISSNHENRSTRWSMHYFDTGVMFNEHRIRYVYRTARGRGINKVDKQETFPTNLRDDQTYLGSIEMIVSPTGQGPEHIVRFTPADESIAAVDLPHNKIVEAPELNISFWRYGDLDDPYVRIHNYERPFAERFANPEFFRYNANFRVEALYTPYDEPRPTDVPNSAGEIDEDDDRHGEIEFILKGKYYKLYVYDNEQIRFTDLSEKVYPGGRYLSPEEEDLEKRVFFLDFNFSYDPPCAYSQAYTCSLPMPEEHIDQEVEAGRIYSAWDVY